MRAEGARNFLGSGKAKNHVFLRRRRDFFGQNRQNPNPKNWEKNPGVGKKSRGFGSGHEKSRGTKSRGRENHFNNYGL